MKTIFDNKVFDVNVFVNYPKCRGQFVGPNGSGCLLTAFWATFGLEREYISANTEFLQVQTMKLASKVLGLTYKDVIMPVCEAIV